MIITLNEKNIELSKTNNIIIEMQRKITFCLIYKNLQISKT